MLDDEDEDLPTLDELAVNLHPPRRTVAPEPDNISIREESEMDSEDGWEEEDQVAINVDHSIDDEGNSNFFLD